MAIPPKALDRVDQAFLGVLRKDWDERAALALAMYRAGSSFAEIADATTWDEKLCEDVILNGLRVTFRVRDARKEELA